MAQEARVKEAVSALQDAVEAVSGKRGEDFWLERWPALEDEVVIPVLEDIQQGKQPETEDTRQCVKLARWLNQHFESEGITLLPVPAAVQAS